MTVAGAVKIAAQIQPGLTLLTHLCHEVDHAAVETELPADVRLAYDQMQIEVTNGESRKLA